MSSADKSPPLRAALEAALVENPDDLAAHRAYADLLAEAGDPRGEFIQVQLALEDEILPLAQRKRLKAREEELLQEHGRAWLGKLAPYLLDQQGFQPFPYRTNEVGYQYRLARGWLESIHATDMPYSFARVLARAPEARMLRELVITDIDTYPDLDEDQEGTRALRQLRSAPFLQNLRVFQVGGRQPRNCHVTGSAAVGLVRKMPALEELRLEAHRVDTRKLFGLALPRLRQLRVYHVHHYAIPTLAGNPSLTRLTHLELYPHALEIGDREAYLRLWHLRALARSPHLRALTHLQFRESDMGDEGIREVIESGLLGRLKVLDLAYGRVTDAGAQLLAGRPELRGLERLDLRGNCLTEAGIALLRATGVALEAGEQDVIGSEAYHNQEYLFHGDME